MSLTRIASAPRAISAGLHAVVHSTTTNLRIYVGLILVGVVSPSSMVFYKIFDKEAVDQTWYHLNFFYLFHVLGPYLLMGFFIVGMYHLFPNGSKRSYILAMPLGYIISKSILIILCTSNEEWHESVSLPMFAMGAGIALVLFVSIDWFAWRKYHKFDSIPARIKGIIAMPGLDAEAKLRLIEGENNKLFTFHKDF
jgi:hypothetical protein